jgi:hypothetical protein
MCLSIREEGKWVSDYWHNSVWQPTTYALANTTKKLKNSKKPIKVYKLLKKSPTRLLSFYTSSVWEKGKVKISSRKKLKNPAELTKNETVEQVVNHGLHFYMNRRDAIGDCPMFYGDDFQVWEVLVNPEDVVAFGDFRNGGPGVPSLVAHKAKLIKRVIPQELLNTI